MRKVSSNDLVAGLEHQFYFSMYWESSSKLTFIFFRGVAQPPSDVLLVISPEIEDHG